MLCGARAAGTVRRDTAEVVDDPRYSRSKAGGDARRHQIPRDRLELVASGQRASDAESPSAREKGKRKRNQHRMNRVALDGGSASHAAGLVQTWVRPGRLTPSPATRMSVAGRLQASGPTSMHRRARV